MICPACDFDPSLCVENTYTITIDLSAQSLNDTGINTKNNRGYKKYRRRWERALREHKVPAAEKKRRVYFDRRWRKGKRAYDFGNLVGGFKPLLDMIVKAGWLLDDSPKHCSEYYRQSKSPDGLDHVIITLEDFCYEP